LIKVRKEKREFGIKKAENELETKKTFPDNITNSFSSLESFLISLFSFIFTSYSIN
jgi:hypothetical protein